MAEESFLINPVRKRKMREKEFSMARHRRNPIGEELMLIGSNPRHRKNPEVSIVPKNILPLLASGAAGALASSVLPGMLKLDGYMKLLAQAGIGLGGGFAVVKVTKNPDLGTAFVIGAIAPIVANLINTKIFGGLGEVGEMGYFVPQNAMGELVSPQQGNPYYSGDEDVAGVESSIGESSDGYAFALPMSSL